MAIKEPPLFPPDYPPPKDSDILLALGRRLRQARLRTGMTQNALGSLIGYKQRMISHVERGLNGMPWHQTVRATALLNISMDHLQAGPRRTSKRPRPHRTTTFSADGVNAPTKIVEVNHHHPLGPLGDVPSPETASMGPLNAMAGVE